MAVVVLVVSTLGVPAPAGAAEGMEIVRLGRLPGHVASEAIAISDNGTVVGLSYTLDKSGYPVSHPVRWAPDGTISALGELPGTRYTIVKGINHAGTSIVGTVSKDDRTHAVKWNSAGAITVLAVPPNIDSDSASAHGVNDNGVIVGVVASVDYEYYAIRWNADGTITDLGTLPDGPQDAAANGINDNGVIVGRAMKTDAWESAVAVRWNGDGAIGELPPLANQGRSEPRRVNNHGVSVGWAFVGERVPAVRWNVDGTVTELTTDFSDECSVSDINADGVAVGRAGSGEQWKAVRWDAAGVAVELGGLPHRSASWANGINSLGVIVGAADDAQRTNAVRWQPMTRR